MPPRATRNATKRPRYVEPATDEEDEALSEQEYVSKPKAKRPRTQRGKQGRLAALLKMPLEVVFLIMGELDPSDLLTLARTSKNFREILMDRSNARLWRSARENVEDLPPCPDDMSEPAYADLMFRTACKACGRAGCDKLYWDLRARFCKKCTEYEWNSRPFDLGAFVGRDLNGLSFPRGYLPIYLFVRVVTEAPMSGQRSEYWLGHAEKLQLYRPDLHWLRATLSRLEPDEIDAFIDQRAQELRQSRQQTEALIEWHNERQRDKEDEKDLLLKDRYKSIKQKLVELGYKNDIEKIYGTELTKHPLVAQPKPLTDRIWTNIKPKLVEFMEDVRHDRLIREREATITKNLKVFDKAVTAIRPWRRGDPSLLELAVRIPEVRKALDVPANKAITTAHFKFLKTALPAYTEKWKEDAAAYLGELVRKKIKLPKTADPLALAVGSVFKCTACGITNVFPNVLSHWCDKRGRRPPLGRRDYYEEIVARNTRGNVWQAKAFDVDVHSLQHLVKLFGLNPSKATIRDMDASPCRLTCTHASHVEKHTIEIMTWRTMYLHMHRGGHSDGLGEIKVVSDAQREAAKPLEAAVKTRELKSKAEDCPRRWRCAHCPTYDGVSQGLNKAQAIQHVKKLHEIVSPDEQTDILYDEYDGALDVLSHSICLVDENIRDTDEARYLKYRVEKGMAAWFVL